MEFSLKNEDAIEGRIYVLPEKAKPGRGRPPGSAEGVYLEQMYMHVLPEKWIEELKFAKIEN